MALRAVPLTLADANLVVEAIHRHHKKSLNHRFSLGAVDAEGVIRGVAICGRPVARMVDHRMVLEVARVATDGTRNCCSFLLGAAARAARAMGYASIQTYTLPQEGGASLRGAGWEQRYTTKPRGSWTHSDGRARDTRVLTSAKTLWVKELQPICAYTLPESVVVVDDQLTLFV